MKTPEDMRSRAKHCPSAANCSKALSRLKEAEYLLECAYVATSNDEIASLIADTRTSLGAAIAEAVHQQSL